jgi:hypothetical protein
MYICISWSPIRGEKTSALIPQPYIRYIYISWPPNRAEEIAKKQLLDRAKTTGNPFAEFLKRKTGSKIFRCLVRYAEGKHFASIKDRANLR